MELGVLVLNGQWNGFRLASFEEKKHRKTATFDNLVGMVAPRIGQRVTINYNSDSNA